MISMLASFEETLAVFFEKLTQSLGFIGYLAIALGVEILLIAFYGIKSAFSYEARFKRGMNKANQWLFKNKTITEENFNEFCNVLKKSPKRVTHFWQNYILYREGGPNLYLSEENLITKPLKTSSWANNVKNLGIATGIWAAFSTLMGFASQANKVWNFSNATLMLLFPILVVLLGGVAAITIKGFRVFNLDDIYESYHIFIRFLTNACDQLPPFIDLDGPYTKKELSKVSAALKEFYETKARKEMEEIKRAKKLEERNIEYDFKEVGVDGALLLNRAMLESETYLNKKAKILSEIARVEARKEATRRQFENIQMELQRKIQASKENIQKLIEQQAATTSRIEVGLLRQQQDKEAKKLEELQRDYDKEETRYKGEKDVQEKEIADLSKIIGEGLDEAEKGMLAEYRSFLEKAMKAANALAEKNIEKEHKALIRENEKNERELISVQTQIKRLLDENQTLRAKIDEYDPNFKNQENRSGHYDENGNFIYADGSYHDAQGLFHDVDGNVYNMNGELVSKDYTEEEVSQNEREELVKSQINQFGAYISEKAELPAQEKTEEANEQDRQAQLEEIINRVESETAEEKPVQGGWTNPVVEDFKWDEDETTAPAETVADQPVEEKPAQGGWANPIVEDFKWDEDETVTPAEETAQESKEELPTEEFNNEEAPTQTEPVEEKEGELPVEDFDWFAEPVEETVKDEPAEEKQKEETPVQTAPAKKRGRPRKEEKVEQVAPAKKRGRPRKEETVIVEAPAKKRGRPRKEEKVEKVAPAKKRGRPRKTEAIEEKPAEKASRPKPRKRVVKEEPVAQTAPAKKRGRPRKETPVVEQPAKKRGRPRKEDNAESFKKISDLISEEEAKLRKMKADLNNEIEQVISADNKSVDKEKEKLLKEFEELKVQAEKAKNSTGEDIVAINKRLEELIKEINAINNKK